ncbi:MAG: sedoheptulose 7-phosphate cyclase [Telluria sp.]
MTSGVVFNGSAFHCSIPSAWRYSVDMSSSVLDPDNSLLADYCAGRQAVLFASPMIDALYGAALRRYCEAMLAPGSWRYFVLKTGEHNKTMRSAELVCEHAKAAGMDRNGVLVAVGGGILCDIVGFAASMYKRGIRYIKVNTTLVGQIDVGVGVKTGVNHLASKNMLGSYYPAYASINDQGFLRTLPARQISCGLAEIIKMAVILSEELFELLETHAGSMQRRRFGPGSALDAERDRRVLQLAIQLMMDELSPNLQETELARLVDFGHSFSPAIEIDSGHVLQHGEAVAIDMALSACIAVRMGMLEEGQCRRILALLRACGLPLYDAACCRPALMQAALDDMHLHRGGRINLVVPTGIGSASFIHHLASLPDGLLEQACEDLRHHAAPAGAMHDAEPGAVHGAG